MAGGIIGEADILIGADATNLARDVQKQASANLKSAGQALGQQLAGSVAKAATASASKISAPLAKSVANAAASAKKPMQDFVSGFKSAEAAASSFTGKVGKMGGAARSAVTAATAPLANLKAGFDSSTAAASSFTGRMGTLGGVAAKALNPAIGQVKNFTAGWSSASAGLSKTTGLMGTLGTAAQSAGALASSALKNGLAKGSAAAFSALQSGATRAWDALKSGAAKAASAAGNALKTGLGSAAKGAAASIAGGVAVMLGKGFARLNSLNQAEARLSGLGIAGKQLESVMKSADDAVAGTAFSMADAANAAGMLSSAGVSAGKSMDGALDAMVASAAASGRELGDVTPIFTKMAASGKVTGDTMSQMLDAGINASGALQKSLGKTADEITAMVSSGTIDFDTFTEAINGDLSMLAAKMGGTLGGMASNVLAAFGRIGAAVQKPLFDGLLVAMPSVLDFTKRLATAVNEFMEPLQGKLEPLAQNVAKILDGINFDSEGIGSFVTALAPLLPLLGGIVGVSGGLLSDVPVIGKLFEGMSGPIGVAVGALAALTMVDPSTLAAGFENIAGFVSSQLPGLIDGAVGMIETGLSNLVQNLPIMLEGIVGIVTQVVEQLVEVLPTVIPLLVDAIGGMIPVLIQSLLTALPLLLNAAMQLFGGIVTGLVETLPGLVTMLVDSIPMLIDTLVAAIPMILEGALSMFMGIMDALVIAVPQIITALVTALPTVIASLVNALPAIITAAISFFLGIVTALVDSLPVIITALVNAIPQIITAIVDAIPMIVSAAIDLFLGLITGLLTALPDILIAVVGLIPVIIGALIDSIPLLIEAGVELFKSLMSPEVIKEVLTSIGSAITNDLLPGIWNAITGQGEKAAESGKKIGTDAAAGMATSAADMNASAAALGTGAAASLGSQATDMSAAAGKLGAGAVTGLAGQTAATKTAATDLANAATIDPVAKAAETKAAGTKIAAAFAAGITSGKVPTVTAVKGLTASVQTSLTASSAGFTATGLALSKGIATGILQGTPGVTFAMQVLVATVQSALISGVVGRVGAAFASLWQGRVSPVLSAMTAGFSSATQSMRAQWVGLATSLSAGFTGQIRPMLLAFASLVRTGPPSAFAAAARGIASAFNAIREAAARPVRFVIETVMNGLIGTMNQIPGVNVPKLMMPGGFARGGILPGMSSMRNGDDQLIAARRGEGVMVSEALRTSADRSAFLAANAAGRSGVGFASLLGGGFARGGLVNPLPRGSYSVSQAWGNQGHNGIDLAAAMGTKVFAAAKGIVQLAGQVPMGGNEIYVQHDNGLGTRYSHLSAFAAKVGQTVRANQTIGRVGSTGMSTGPHLHYMVHNPGGGPGNYGNHVNPAPFMGLFGSEVSGVADELGGMAKAATAKFSARFPSGNMFNAATAGIMAQTVKSMVSWGAKQVGTDDSTGDQGRTGKGSLNLFDAGGMMPHGGMGINLSGKPEAVLTNAETQGYKALMGAFGGGTGSTGGVGATGATGAGVTLSVSATVSATAKRTFKDIGEQLGSALVQGFKGTASEASSAAQALTASLKDAHTNYYQNISATEQKVIGLRKTLDEKENGRLTKAARAAAKEELKRAEQELKAQRGFTRERFAILTKAARAQEALIAKNAKAREALTLKIAAAQEKLDARIATRESFVQNIRSGIVGQGDVSGSTSPAGMIRNLQRKITASSDFNAAIAQLKKMGLDDLSIEQLTASFATSGSARAAQRLAEGGAGAVKEIADLQKRLGTAAGKVANTSGDILYKAGIDAARGLVKGLESQEKALEAVATKLANTIADRIAKALKIKSPSRVTWGQGVNVGQGLAGGMLDEVSAVQAAAEAMYAPLTRPLSIDGSLGGSRGSSAATGTQGVAHTVIISEGAIVVHESGDARRTATEVVDKIAEVVELGGL